MKRAAFAAIESSCKKRVGAVAVKGGSLLATAFNLHRNDVLVLEEEYVRAQASICAERVLLRKLGSSAKGSIIYVARLMGDGSYGTSKPCERCQPALEKAGVKRVIYIS